jgi:hypothetical protein
VAISPPSDIVLDVASAADPVKLRVATDRLAKLAADPNITGASFSASLAAAREPLANAQSPASQIASPGLANARGSLSTTSQKDQLKTYQKFEAVLLQNFVEAILPKDTELFGDKNSAEIYRSMMAEQFANQLAKSGSLGIAKQIMAAHSPNVPHAVAKPAQS